MKATSYFPHFVAQTPCNLIGVGQQARCRDVPNLAERAAHRGAIPARLYVDPVGRTMPATVPEQLHGRTAHISANATAIEPADRRAYLACVLGSGMLIGLAFDAAALTAGNAANAAPPAVESQFTEVLRPRDSRLNSAREAAKRGDSELAIYDYLASIEEDSSTAEAAITEMVDVFLAAAHSHKKAGSYVDESAQISRCYQTLQQLKHADAATKAIPLPARLKLFRSLDHVHSEANKTAQSHIEAANRLRKEAKNFWDDDEAKQAEALHMVNLAWSYYPDHTDEAMTSEMYKIWADMKSELPTWQYNQVMERDRLQLGRVVGDRP